MKLGHSAPVICFSHGLESGPWGTKIMALKVVAEEAGWHVESIDYQGMMDPHERVAKLEAWCADAHHPLVLAGSSMGGHVAAAAAVSQGCEGLFLMAPAFYMPRYEEFTPEPPDCPVSIVHGWHDDVVPWQNSHRYAQACSAEYVLQNDDHRLIGCLPAIGVQLRAFLDRIRLATEETNG